MQGVRVIRAKFKCVSVQTFEFGSETVRFCPASGSDENKSWSKYTPSGSVEMGITAEGAVGAFKPGAEYFLDFTPAVNP